MKKLMIYFLATALACGLVVSVGHAQAPPYFGHTSPSMYPYPPPPPPPPIPDLVGCWRMELIVNLPLTYTNQAIKVLSVDATTNAYLEIDSMDGTWIFGWLHTTQSGSVQSLKGEGTISGRIVSLFANTDASASLEVRRYCTGTLTKENGTWVIYGMGITSHQLKSGSIYPYDNQIGTFKAIRISTEGNCPP